MKLLITFIFSLIFLTTIQAGDIQKQETPSAVKVATFDVNATPPLGSAMAYDPVKRHDELTLRCRGIVISGAGKPIVLCAVDWIGIANEGHDQFREILAAAAGTTRDRVVVHTLHQHDAPGCDFTAERLIRDLGLKDFGRFEGGFHRDVMQRAAKAIKGASAQPVTHYGWGVAVVKQVASNRRILGPDGKVRAVRYTATKDPKLRAEPEGVIDPELALLSFWDENRPIALISYYATHPQSYYRTGVPSPDFPGIARFIRGQAIPEAIHVHFNGAGGNIGAGKYNDGSKENRMVLAQRLADGMKQAFTETKKHRLSVADVGWEIVPVKLPVAPHLDAEKLISDLKTEPARGYVSKADQLAWVLRCKAGHAIDIACLQVGQARVLHMPGELFVEYQLAAKKMRPDLQVAMAAYGDYGPGYIGTTVAYSEGGYETSPRASSVAPEVEPVLMNAMRQLLGTAASAQRTGPDAEIKVKLAKALTLHASFDKGLDADYSRGDKTCYVQGAKLVAAKPNADVTLAPDAGRFGGALHFPKKGTTRPSFKDGGVLGYNAKSWSASVSAWLRLHPDKDLEPGYCDPIQIVGNDSKKGYIFLEWSKDETPRLFRYAIRPLFHIWNPKNQPWHEIPADKKPAVEVARAPFSRDKWTHVVFTLENVNDKTKPPIGKLFLNGKLQGTIEKWEMTFDWDPAKVLLVLGASYVGYIDDLAVFDRPLTAVEVERIHGLKNGVRELYP